MMQHHAYFLTTRRLGFRSWREEDLPLAIALWADPGVTRFISRKGLSESEVKQLLESYIAMERTHGIQYWPIFLLRGDEHLGCCGLRPYRPAESIPEFGVHIRPEYWRRGFAEEAGSAVIQYALHELNAAAIFAGHNPQNTASRNLLQRLGFTYTHDQFYEATGLHHPSYLLTRPQL